jgi:hypothetical protein
LIFLSRAACVQILVLVIAVSGVRAGSVPEPTNAAQPASLPEALPEVPSPRQLSSVVDASRPALQRCYEEWLSLHPLRSEAVFELRAAVTIQPDGSALSVELEGVDDQPKLASCVETVLAEARYPRSVQGAEFVAPLLLAGRERPVPDSDAPSDALPLTPRQLRDAMLANTVSLEPCFEEWLRAHPELPKLVANVSINPDGSTRAAQLRGADQPAVLKTCLREALLAWRFPRSGRHAEFAFPLSYRRDS